MPSSICSTVCANDLAATVGRCSFFCFFLSNKLLLFPELDPGDLEPVKRVASFFLFGLVIVAIGLTTVLLVTSEDVDGPGRTAGDAVLSATSSGYGDITRT